jgi:N-acetylmuramoyl-L-alanine amidase
LKTRQKLVAATKGWHYRPAGASGSSSSSASQSASSGGSSAAGSAAAADALPSTAGGLSQSDLSLMAHVVYAEARGEPFEGQVAVAAVILNRLKDPSKFPHTVAGIIYQPLAFTSVQDGQINLTPNAQAKEAVMDAVEGWDPSHGATYYFDPATATSPWIWSKPEIVTIGHHIFCSS